MCNCAWYVKELLRELTRQTVPGGALDISERQSRREISERQSRREISERQGRRERESFERQINPNPGRDPYNSAPHEISEPINCPTYSQPYCALPTSKNKHD